MSTLYKVALQAFLGCQQSTQSLDSHNVSLGRTPQGGYFWYEQVDEMPFFEVEMSIAFDREVMLGALVRVLDRVPGGVEVLDVLALDAV